MSGKLCFETIKNDLTDYAVINATDLQDGLYLITETTVDGNNIFNRKFLVQK